MSETLRDLVVSLSLQTDNFTRNIKSVSKQIAEAESQFKLAGAGVEGFEKTATGLATQLSTLERRLSLQKDAVTQYERALTAANEKLTECFNRQNDYAQRLTDAKTAHQALKEQVFAAAQQVRTFSSTLGENDSATIAAKANLDALKAEYMALKHPAFLHLKHVDGEKLLKQRSSLLVHEVSGVIFSSTDTLIISIFCGLSEASVYAVYSMVFNALRTIIGQVFNSTSYLLGNSYSQNSESYPTTHDKYNIIYTGGVFACFTVAYWMIIPFITLYTRGITDANYLDPKLPMLFCLIELLSACRVVDNQLIKNAYHAKQTLNRSMIEAAINLVVSIVAVQYLGMYGVLLGTIAALLYRSNDVILYANHRILRRSALREYALYGANALVFSSCVILCSKITLSIGSYLQWFGYAVVVGIAVFAVYALIDAVIFRCLTHSSH